MSNGLGHVQRTIIGSLSHAPYATTLELIEDVYNLHKRKPRVPPTQAQIKSVWRALRRLQDQGMIEESERVNRGGYRLWVIKRTKPLTRAAINAKLRAQKPRLVG